MGNKHKRQPTQVVNVIPLDDITEGAIARATADLHTVAKSVGEVWEYQDDGPLVKQLGLTYDEYLKHLAADKQTLAQLFIVGPYGSGKSRCLQDMPSLLTK
eukprot:TRINITY_DN2488_c0_g1_i1.p3 TRINITY_DN2488_c0_g1~~TRINITY_DN2488_c0_g1_i1.p3  ORF type:complete len:101 (+),score=17.26 TRINITY_DN2488_c0_g1_i1:576-878(+)